MNMYPFPFDRFTPPADGIRATCPACGRADAVSVDARDVDNVKAVCAFGCSHADIMTAAGYRGNAPYYLAKKKEAEEKGAADQLHPEMPSPNGEQRQQKGKERFTLDLMQCELALAGYDLKYNEITGRIDITGETYYGRAMSVDDVAVDMHSLIGGKYTGASLQTITAYAARLARRNKYNPVLDRLSSLEWDGNDRWEDLFSLLGLNPSDTLSRALVQKWFLQSVALLYNDQAAPFGADGVLVLNGEQGTGKTSFFRLFALEDAWFAEGACVKDYDKDTTRRIVTKWISELGEVESTLKSDISSLKAFVTASVDEYRLPYAKGDTISPRHTSLCATCNSSQYLIDPTGNRRWWSVPITQKLDYAAIEAFPRAQMWAQVYATVSPLEYADKAKCFRLTAAEHDALAERNGEYEKPVKGEQECRELIAAAKERGAVFAYMTPTAWKNENSDTLRNYSASQIGAALKHIGLVQKSVRQPGSKDPVKAYELPTREIVPRSLRMVK